MTDIADFDSFKDQESFNEYVIKREAAAVAGSFRGLAAAAEQVVPAHKSLDGATLHRWISDMAETVETVFDVKPA